MEQVRILSIENATYNVAHVRTEKPHGISYHPGQAVDVSVNKPNWKAEIRPFTFTSLPTDNYLEFFIKQYPEHNGVTDQIGRLNQNDTLLIGDVFGAIEYKGEGVFIAGGAGITPFIAILKDLKSKNKLGNNSLIFANNTAADIIHNEFFTQLLGKHFINVLSKEKKEGYEYGYINKEMIKSQIHDENTNFYLCGPPPMMNAVLKQLKELGIEDAKIIHEEF